VNPHRGKVVDLVNPYMNADTNQTGGLCASGVEYMQWWLHRNPGRWALVGENGMGATSHIIERIGLKWGVRGRRVYAQLPHPEAEPLAEALHRSATLIEALPPLERDPFKWTPAELAEACQVARDNLFPVSQVAA
jgi:hypothetical protein